MNRSTRPISSASAAPLTLSSTSSSLAIPDRPDPIEGLHEWLSERVAKKPNAIRAPDLAHEPVVLIRPELGRVVWDPPGVPPPRIKTAGHPATLRRAPA